MSQEVVFNELCVRYEKQRLDKPFEDAVSWLVQFSNLLLLIFRHRNINQLRVPIEFKSSILVNGYSLGRLLNEDEPLIDRDHRTNIKSFTDRAMYLEDVAEITDDEGLFHQHSKLYMFRHVESGELCRGFGAAHLLDALSISIDTEEDYWNCESVQIEKHQNSGSSPVAVPHACKVEHLRMPTRIFERNPKHDLVVEREYISKLDLADEEAQSVLDRAVQADGEQFGGTRLYGFSPRTSRLYAFPAHREGYYHAYPIKSTEIPYCKVVLRRLKDRNVIDDEIEKWIRRGG